MSLLDCTQRRMPERCLRGALVATLLTFTEASVPIQVRAAPAPVGFGAPACSVSRVPGGELPYAAQFGGISAGSASDAWAVGSYQRNSLEALYALADHWDGKAWTVVYPPSIAKAPTLLNGVATRTPSDAWAVGSGAFETLTEHWDGEAWKIVASPNPGGPHNINRLNGVAAFAANDAVAVGEERVQQGDNFFPLVEHWNGTAWSIVAAPGPRYGFYYGVSGSSGRNVWAVGGIYHANSSEEEPLALHYNGSSWQAMRPPMPPGTVDALFDGVVALAPNDVWAVGSSSKGRGLYDNLTEHWNGRSWSIVPSPNLPTQQTQGLVGVSAGSPNDVWAVGGNLGSSGKYGALAMHWNGTAWHLVDVSHTFAPYSVLAGVTSFGSRMLTAGYDVENAKADVLGLGGCTS